MDTDRTSRSAVLTTRLASLAAALAVVVGAMVLIGWAFDIAVLKSVLPGWVAMKANTAVCFILIGVALWLNARQHSALLLARLCGLLMSGVDGGRCKPGRSEIAISGVEMQPCA